MDICVSLLLTAFPFLVYRLIIKSVYIVVSDPMKYSGVATLSGFLSGEFDIECLVKQEVLSLFELQMGSH